MDPLSRHEIYIPKDAEVKRIALQSLPRSLLTGMGLSVSDSNASRMPLDSPEGIWICPAVLRPKGQKLPSDTGNSLLENVSRLAKKSQASPEPVQMSFVSSNRAARKALQDTLSGVNISADPPTGSDLPPGSAPQTYQIAVVIYHGRIYLSIRKPSQSQRQGETALTAARSAAPSTSSSSQRKRTAPEAPPKAAGKKTPKKRVRIPLPPGSLKLMKNLTLKASSVTQVCGIMSSWDW
ncbi:uncharacterized protein LOC141799905 isoform X1 [Halichoeres trimaculatus]|uniref:uncharacterized protein LOC141799905 isoform X1 n=1 Tax=Halichoeres trimaculatus TaxID=147232 RepID=UPI003D9F7299